MKTLLDKSDIPGTCEHKTCCRGDTAGNTPERHMLLTRRELARRLGCHDRTVRRWTRCGLLPAVVLGRSVFYVWDDILTLSRFRPGSSPSDRNSQPESPRRRPGRRPSLCGSSKSNARGGR